MEIHKNSFNGQNGAEKTPVLIKSIQVDPTKFLAHPLLESLSTFSIMATGTDIVSQRDYHWVERLFVALAFFAGTPISGKEMLNAYDEN